MTSHDPAHYRQRFATLLAGQNTQLAALEDLLKRERTLLETQDVEGLEQAAATRKQCVDQVLRLDDERSALVRASGRSDDAAGLHALLAWCDPDGSLVAAVQEYRDRTLRCRDQNDLNGKLVIARLQRTSGALDALHGGSSGGDTYGPGGAQGHGYVLKLTTRA